MASQSELKGVAIAAVVIAGLGASVYAFTRRCKGPDGQMRCPVTGASGSSAAHAHGHGHGQTSSGHAATSSHQGASSAKARLDAIVPFQPRAFTPEQLARCTGAFEDPLGLLEEAASTDTKTMATSGIDTLEDDLATTQNMVCISVRGIVYKVTPQFYGVGEGYAVYAGKDITRCLAIGKVSDEEANLPWSDASAAAYRRYHAKKECTNNDEDGGEFEAPLINATRGLAAMRDSEPYDGEFTAEELHTLDLWAQKYDKKYQIVGWFAPFAGADCGVIVTKGPCKTTKEVMAYCASRVSILPSVASKGDVPTTKRRQLVGSAGVLPEGVL